MSYILNLSCPDQSGIVATVSTFLFEAGMNINASNQFGDHDTKRFFMRIDFTAGGASSETDVATLRISFGGIATRFNMQWHIYDQVERVRALIMVSRFDHCLVDLMYRTERDSMAMDIVGVGSNHEAVRDRVVSAGLAWNYWGATKNGADKLAFEKKMAQFVADESVELIILARYMQILSADFVSAHAERIINIHHSFLPSFKGAMPYSRAHKEGVKMIGATAHFVTANLDEGPIITQGVSDIRHDMNVDALVNVGRDIERQVLAEAVRLYTERRILLNNNKTVIFA